MRYSVILILLCITLPSVAEVIRCCPIRTIEEVSDGIIVSYTFNNPEIIESDYYPNTKYISYDGFGLNDNDGEPCIPFRNDIFLVPNNCNVTVSVLDSLFTDTTMVLSPSMPVQTDNNSKVIRHNIIPYNGFSPKAIIHSSGVFHNREDALVEVSVIPVKYNYQTNTVRRYSYIRYKLTYSRSNSDFRGERASMAKKICQNVPVREYSVDSTYRNDKHYLIITTTEYKDSLNEFIKWKRLKGSNVHVACRAKGSWTVSAVTDTIQHYYTQDSIKYLLIVGDYDDVPGQQFYNYDAYAITDYQYGLPVNELAQIKKGRLPVNTTTELAIVLNKIIKYEQAPIIDEDFYNTALHCAQFQDGDVDSTGIKDGYEDRCFTMCAEDLRNHLVNNYGKRIIRGYACSPDIFPTNWNKTIYSDGVPIPLAIRPDVYSWRFSWREIKNSIDEGTFYVLYRGHGDILNWYRPGFYHMFAHPLINDNKLPFIFSIACLTGKYNVSYNCLAEDLLKLQSGGCVGMIAASGKSYPGYNDAFVYGMFDAIWPGFSPIYKLNGYGNTSFSAPSYEVGEIMDLGLLRMSETWGAPSSRSTNRLKTKKMYHCFCDPSMMLYTENPQFFETPTIQIDDDTLYVNVSDGECRINVVNNITNEVQSYIGENVAICVGDNDISVCLDKHNYVPYVWQKDIHIQNENILSSHREYHAQNVKVGKHVTDQKPQGNVNVINSHVSIRANNVLLDKGTYINVGSTFKIKTTN